MPTWVILVSCLLASMPATAIAADWYVAPAGQTNNPGTPAAPWDIASALGGAQKVATGDTIHLRAGTYRRRPQEQYEVRLVGTGAKPITVCPAPGERAIIDGGLLIQDPSAHLWIRDLEILVSEPTPKEPVAPGSHPEQFQRPWGGLNISGGKNCKFINLIIHDTRQAVSWWSGSTDSELYGCILYDNGWLATDRGHGHCIYTQNQAGKKTISNCIMTCKYDGTYTVHAYGSSRAFVDNYLIEENVCYGKGPFLVGGGQPSHGISIFRNLLFNVGMRVGYNAPTNGDCEVRDNVIVNGSLEIVKYARPVSQGNLVLKPGEARPKEAKVVLLPNKYDPNRAHLAVFNWQGENEVEVPAGSFLKVGDTFELFDPKEIHGKAAFQGKCSGTSILVPVRGEFGVWVVMKTSSR